MSNRGRFVWYDHLARDVEAARDFYTHVVGWGTQAWQGSADYSMWTAGGVPVGGLMKLPPEMDEAGTPPHWFAHVAVDDVDASARRAEELGGRVLSPPADIPDVGRYAVIADPQGATLSLFRPDRDGTPPGARGPGSFDWHELHTVDHRAAWEFYSELLGWRHVATLDVGPMGDYFMFGLPDDPDAAEIGAMFDAARDGAYPPHWLYYVQVDDIDATVERTRERGGRILHGPAEVPGGGRMAQCLDAQGGPFSLYSEK
ncbi:MAG: VOC family protein [Gemmatimonadota bacterium]